jgi:hypothetical protein
MFNRQWGGMPTRLGSRISLTSLIQTLAAAEHLSFHCAAQALGISQSSVSSRVKALSLKFLPCQINFVILQARFSKCQYGRNSVNGSI